MGAGSRQSCFRHRGGTRPGPKLGGPPRGGGRPRPTAMAGSPPRSSTVAGPTSRTCSPMAASAGYCGGPHSDMSSHSARYDPRIPGDVSLSVRRDPGVVRDRPELDRLTVLRRHCECQVSARKRSRSLQSVIGYDPAGTTRTGVPRIHDTMSSTASVKKRSYIRNET